MDDIDKMRRVNDNGEIGLGPKIVALTRHSRKLGYSKWCCLANEPDI